MQEGSSGNQFQQHIFFLWQGRDEQYSRLLPALCPSNTVLLNIIPHFPVPHHLVVVESPTKAKTIKRFLGKDFTVEASMGHIRDLPQSTLGVDVGHRFEPSYVIVEDKKTVVRNLKKALKGADDLWIATDEDREGEAIGWHLTQALGVDDPLQVKRIVFHEITETAIREAVEHPRHIDMRLVDAQQARRILDRLVGYTLSPFLWRKVFSGLSAGRVQSVAVRIIVDREREVQAFIPREYWTIEAELETQEKKPFTALLDRKSDEKIEIGNEERAQQILRDLEGASFTVESLEEKEVKRTPAPPFTTSTLQQEAARKLGFSVKQTMVVAQQLYEGVDLGKGQGLTGLITYMRTDSVSISEKALSDCKHFIEKKFGREYVLISPRRYRTKSKTAQEAHEAIRPTEMERTPESLEDILDHQQLKLYALIWNRTLATQMPPAEFRRIGADIAANPASSRSSSAGLTPYIFRATGQTLLFDGFIRVYTEGRDETNDERQAEEDGEKILPPLTKGEALALLQLAPEQHFTKPPPRYTEASLVKKLEEEGIGRPSTYAPTISTIQQRGYIRKDAGKLLPEQVAFTVVDLLSEHFPNIVDLTFTAQMEGDLDEIAGGEETSADFLQRFYVPFKELIDAKTKEIQKSDVLKERELGLDPKTGLPVLVRTGRFGPYVQLGRAEARASGKRKSSEGLKTASLPKNANLDAVSLEQALALLRFPRLLGAQGGQDVQVLLGRYGPYVKCGEATAALSGDCDPSTVTLAEAIAFLAQKKEQRRRALEPLRVLGSDPATGQTVAVKDGRYGPYVTDGTTNASIPKKGDPATITLEEAAELLAKKRSAPRRPWRRRG